MSLTSVIQGGINTAFKVLSEFVQTVTITDTVAEYNPATGAADVAQTFTAPALFGGTIEKDGPVVRQGDKELYIKTADVTTEVRAGFTLVDSRGSTWLLVLVSTDPANVCYSCIVRKTR